MKKIQTTGYLALIVAVMCSCNPHTPPPVAVAPPPPATPAPIQSSFNVAAFAQMVGATKNPQLLEQQLNAPGNLVNNLDVNNDGKVDAVKVMEEKNKIEVFDISTTPEVSVATVDISPAGSSYKVYVVGNRSYCGPDYTSTVMYGVADFVMLSYFIGAHPFYVSPYRYGYYPSYYHGYPIVREGFMARHEGGFGPGGERGIHEEHGMMRGGMRGGMHAEHGMAHEMHGGGMHGEHGGMAHGMHGGGMHSEHGGSMHGEHGGMAHDMHGGNMNHDMHGSHSEAGHQMQANHGREGNRGGMGNIQHNNGNQNHPAPRPMGGGFHLGRR